MSSPLPIIGVWGLARRLVHVQRSAARDAALGIVRMQGQPSAKWFATAEWLRQEDSRRHFASLAAAARKHQYEGV